jgi:hypothetical protein
MPWRGSLGWVFPTRRDPEHDVDPGDQSTDSRMRPRQVVDVLRTHLRIKAVGEGVTIGPNAAPRPRARLQYRHADSGPVELIGGREAG